MIWMLELPRLQREAEFPKSRKVVSVGYCPLVMEMWFRFVATIAVVAITLHLTLIIPNPPSCFVAVDSQQLKKRNTV